MLNKGLKSVSGQVSKNLLNLILFILLTACASGWSYTNLTAEQVHARLVNADTLILLDVREASEYREGHIAEPEGLLPLTPVLMPWKSNVLNEFFQLLPKDRDIIVYCRSGRRSEAASQFLESKGFGRLFNMNGGFKSWTYEKREGEFGDHSGLWVSSSALQPAVINCAVEGNSSELIFPPEAVPGKDSVYIELHAVSNLNPQPPGVPQSDIGGLYSVSVLDTFGLSLFAGDSLALSGTVKLLLYTQPSPYSMPPENEGTTVYVPGKGWTPAVFTIKSICFLREENVLRAWYNLSGFYGRTK